MRVREREVRGRERGHGAGRGRGAREEKEKGREEEEEEVAREPEVVVPLLGCTCQSSCVRSGIVDEDGMRHGARGMGRI